MYSEAPFDWVDIAAPHAVLVKVFSPTYLRHCLSLIWTSLLVARATLAYLRLSIYQREIQSRGLSTRPLHLLPIGS